MTAPTFATLTYDVSGITDFYVDYLWVWSGSQWVGVGWGPLAWRQRGYGTRWTRYDTGVVVDEFAYTATSGRWYAVTQWLYDGQRGGYWPQEHATYVAQGGVPFCLVT